ncbi:MAG: HNH endonuclease [Chloroflexi bacterium]|nr:HNH endonuclease [Ardenticatenaceae bacterium]MBL1129017.1 HNH endonuclease [Chloroflexota bacterium]NOG35096.1 HNH endonuclease [Chloroflexota bacterium]
MNPNYPFVAERATHRCEYCHAPEVVFNIPFEVDHVVPPGKGGVESPENWALACRACNLWKSNTVTAVDPETGQLVPLFHPRHHIWEEHFRVQAEAPFRLIGQTPTGRATIEQLKMNMPLQLIARSQWLVLGIFP